MHIKRSKQRQQIRERPVESPGDAVIRNQEGSRQTYTNDSALKSEQLNLFHLTGSNSHLIRAISPRESFPSWLGLLKTTSSVVSKFFYVLAIVSLWIFVIAYIIDCPEAMNFFMYISKVIFLSLYSYILLIK